MAHYASHYPETTEAGVSAEVDKQTLDKIKLQFFLYEKYLFYFNILFLFVELSGRSYSGLSTVSVFGMIKVPLRYII